MARGDPATLREADGDPIALARGFIAAGARWIHVVDLDAAVQGVPSAANLDILAEIARLPVSVQAGGGLSIDAVEQALGRGVTRAVLGSRALSDAAAAGDAVQRHGSRVAVGLDRRGDLLVPRGGLGEPAPLAPVLAWLAGLSRVERGPAAVVVTDVDRDGSLAGPDVAGLRAVAEATGLPVIASGGIRSVSDLLHLAACAPLVTGAIVGRALREGAFTLEEAFSALA
jgi:phosphoribosylformimino-5-aminoimidazole carboxamide ribonucleotide (ProFAR) isomerase